MRGTPRPPRNPRTNKFNVRRQPREPASEALLASVACTPVLGVSWRCISGSEKDDHYGGNQGKCVDNAKPLEVMIERAKDLTGRQKQEKANNPNDTKVKDWNLRGKAEAKNGD